MIDSIAVHPIAQGEPYEVSVYGRLSAMLGVDLYPTARSNAEILAAEGLSRSDIVKQDCAGLTISDQRNDVIWLGRWRAAA
jgi:hypothetical protein